jgi:hypothetical protein
MGGPPCPAYPDRYTRHEVAAPRAVGLTYQAQLAGVVH